MVTVSMELWQAGTMPGGQRCLHSSQVKPGSRREPQRVHEEQEPPHGPPRGGGHCPGGPNNSCRAASLRGSFTLAVVWSQAEVSLMLSYRQEPVSGPTPGPPERALALLSQQPLWLSLVSSRPQPCLSQV